MQIPARGYSGCCALWSCALPAYMEIEHLIRYVHLAVGLMEIEHLIRYTPLAVGLMEIEH